MAIKDLQARQGKVELTAEVVSKADAREFEKFGKKGKVCNAKIKDDTGEVTLTLWNEQADQVNVGDVVKISNGWVSEWQGEMQLSTGKFGSLSIVGKGTGNEPAGETPSQAPKEKTSQKEPLHKETKDPDTSEEETFEASFDEEEVI